ncbi:hypothetical protein COO60DRAFT_1503940 [Scenedesmus sp. NREL 46B-D3]|nr:hypothetical protein COO60DRAFT_1503940 [Scenedesmus sp. NREL 46B-D3]
MGSGCVATQWVVTRAACLADSSLQTGAADCCGRRSFVPAENSAPQQLSVSTRFVAYCISVSSSALLQCAAMDGAWACGRESCPGECVHCAAKLSVQMAWCSFFSLASNVAAAAAEQAAASCASVLLPTSPHAAQLLLAWPAGTAGAPPCTLLS